jgi:hypothetical protein
MKHKSSGVGSFGIFFFVLPAYTLMKDAGNSYKIHNTLTSATVLSWGRQRPRNRCIRPILRPDRAESSRRMSAQ